VKHRLLALIALPAAAAVIAACGGSKPTPPTTPAPVAATLSAPKVDSPTSGSQLDTLRPTLTVQNVTSDQPGGTRTYEFQISDTTAFTAATTQSVSGFDATVGKTGVAEGSGGKTSFTAESDLQPTTRFYWRARAIQGTTTGPWSETFEFKSKLVGFNRAGELYDPLIHGETVGEIVGSVSFIPGKGAQLNSGQSYIKYLLVPALCLCRGADRTQRRRVGEYSRRDLPQRVGGFPSASRHARQRLALSARGRGVSAAAWPRRTSGRASTGPAPGRCRAA
jgi:hypothetical protein